MKGVSTALCFCYSSLAGEQRVLNWFHSTANGQAASGGRWEGREVGGEGGGRGGRWEGREGRGGRGGRWEGREGREVGGEGGGRGGRWEGREGRGGREGVKEM